MISFILNDKTIQTSQRAGITLLDFIRYERHLPGTKIGCREGDCGACTVLIGDVRDGMMHYQSMTSCITPLGNANGKHVITVEGLNMKNLTPVQQALVDTGGTQCGFCTVGFVVSLTGFCLSREDATLKGAISAMDGNICRCTGYKSIERAASKLVGMLTAPERIDQQERTDGSGFAIDSTHGHAEKHPSDPASDTIQGDPEKRTSDPIPWLIKNGFLPDYFADIPQRLSELAGKKPRKNGRNGLLAIGGGTDLFVQQHDDLVEEDIDLLFDRRELNNIEKSGNRVVLGSSVTPTDMMESSLMREIFPELWNHLKLISSTQIRNMGTLAGNFVNASPIGDLTIWFLALGSNLVLRDEAGSEREVPLRDFFLDYKVLNKKADENIARIIFPIPDLLSKFHFEKVSKRKYLDIATVNSAAQITISGDVITHIHLSGGGIGPTPKYLSETSEFLTGKPISPEVLTMANDVMQSEISPISDVRGSADYKRLLLRQLFFAHFVELYPDYIKPAELV